MNDDLISRKEALERLRLLREFNHQEVIQVAVDAAEQQINFCGTAFDKEKVIDELQKPDPIIRTFIGKSFTTIDRAIEIVEKGGIE